MNEQAFAISGDFKGNQLAAGGALIDKIRDVLSTLSIALPPKEDFLAQVGNAYDAYVKPIDLPYVPNFVEPWVDSVLKGVVLQQASGIYDQLAR